MVADEPDFAASADAVAGISALENVSRDERS
jgi:hypothetical protein